MAFLVTLQKLFLKPQLISTTIIEYPEYTEVVPINDDLYQYSIVNTFGTKIISGEFQPILRIKKSSIPPGNYFIQIQSPYHEEFLKMVLIYLISKSE